MCRVEKFEGMAKKNLIFQKIREKSKQVTNLVIVPLENVIYNNLQYYYNKNEIYKFRK